MMLEGCCGVGGIVRGVIGVLMMLTSFSVSEMHIGSEVLKWGVMSLLVRNTYNAKFVCQLSIHKTNSLDCIPQARFLVSPLPENTASFITSRRLIHLLRSEDLTHSLVSALSPFFTRTLYCVFCFLISQLVLQSLDS